MMHKHRLSAYQPIFVRDTIRPNIRDGNQTYQIAIDIIGYNYVDIGL